MNPSHTTFDVREPISGYVTRELIGRGGFGEVWKAEAPGGLEKAIKIVHAGIDSTRAERELRALERVKDVRHPLTLSIERIEIIEGTLVIVTELADCSLKDVFKQERARGLPGIPRDRLLTFLRDAADALDYIYEEHSLQHLDIKPENLLVVGNRLKLGDFGLLKNIYERGASLVSGLTPTYAPPELFEGRPTRQSDQYSLAIVYQQMLTGELPFNGATSAQMAREHLSGVPRLDALPRMERPIVARALSKVPGERFDHCAALISSLAAAPIHDAEEPVVEPEEVPETLQTQTVSVAIPVAGQGDHNAGGADGDEDAQSGPDVAEGPIDPVLSALELSLRPARRASDSSSGRSDAIPRAGFVPTVFLGVGGTAGLVFQELRRRISDAYGSLADVPAIQMVLMDTDGKQINSLMQREDWEEMDVVALPLRRPQDYKFRESGINKWLHRRWLYNMSRSLQTDGYRPLGRLAFVDHGARALVSIRTALTNASSADSVSRTADTSGLPFQQGHVRVVIVASISGGTGSGIALDLAYAVRGELKSRGCSDEDVLGMLLHSTPAAPAERDKALANAYAALTELGHYSVPGHFYPGEDSVKAPSFHGDNRTFGATYLVNLGDSLDTRDWHAGAARVAEYLFCTTATPARLVIDAARHADEGGASANARSVLLRSLDVRRLDRIDSHEISDCIERACRDVVAMWQSGRQSEQFDSASVASPGPAPFLDVSSEHVREETGRADADAARWLHDCGLEPNALQRAARGIVEEEWGGPEQDHLREMFQQLCREGDQQNASRQQLLDAADRLMDRLLGDSALITDSEQTRICDRLRQSLASRAAEIGRRLVDRVGGLVDSPDNGVKAARAATDAMTRQLKDLGRALDQRGRGSEEHPHQTLEDSGNTGSWLGLFRRRQSGDARAAAFEEVLSHSLQRLDAAKHAALRQFLNQIEVHISVAADHLNHLSRDLKCLSSEFQSPSQPDGIETDAAPALGPVARMYERRIHEALKRDREIIARTVNDQLHDSLFNGEEKLRRFLGVHNQLQSTLLAPLRNQARQVVLSHVRQATQDLIDESARQHDQGEEPECARLVAEFINERADQPSAGTDRLVVLAPESADPRRFEAAFASCTTASLIPARTNGITFCYEGEARPLETVADEIIDQQDLYRQLAEKLHTREDVEWSPLLLLGAWDRASRSDSDSVPAR